METKERKALMVKRIKYTILAGLAIFLIISVLWVERIQPSFVAANECFEKDAEAMTSLRAQIKTIEDESEKTRIFCGGDKLLYGRMRACVDKVKEEYPLGMMVYEKLSGYDTEFRVRIGRTEGICGEYGAELENEIQRLEF